jgi:hypothetical protein
LLASTRRSSVNDLRHMLDMALLTGICALHAER